VGPEDEIEVDERKQNQVSSQGKTVLLYMGPDSFLNRNAKSDGTAAQFEHFRFLASNVQAGGGVVLGGRAENAASPLGKESLKRANTGL